MGHTSDLKSLSDEELLRRLNETVGHCRRNEADLVALIAEVDDRRLFAREAVSSMFGWCTEILHLSEYEAYLRIAVARASREHPVLLTMLHDGRLHLSGIALLARHLTRENRDELLERAAGKPHRDIKELVAELVPKPDAPSRIRKLPEQRSARGSTETGQLGTYQVASPTRAGGSTSTPPVSPPMSNGGAAETGALGATGETHAAAGIPAANALAQAPSAPPPSSATIDPLGRKRYRVQFTADAELKDKLERLQALMRSSVSDGDLGRIIEQAVTEKLERLEARRYGKTKTPRKSLAGTDTRPKSRHIPAAVRRAVEKRDGGRCTYRNKEGRRCTERHNLEFHHREPYGFGGDHSPCNLALMCRMHNNLAAEHDYGKEVMWHHRQRSSRSRPDRTPSGPVSRKRGHG